MTASHPSRPGRATQAGSAYIVALLVLVVLTIIGLGLALITQTEMQVGSNERTVQRVFYAADSGLNGTTAKALVEADYAAMSYELQDPDVPAALNLHHQVNVSPFYPIMTAPCHLCEINGAGEYGREPYFKINYGVTSRANRHLAAGSDAVAGKTLSTLVEVQPWQLLVEALEPLNDPAQLDNLLF